MSNTVPWQVRIALDSSEVGPIETAMALEVPWEQWSLRLPRVEDEAAPALLIEVPADSHGSAEDEAVRIYASARQRAGLPPTDALVLGALTPIFADDPGQHELDERRVLEDGEERYGVFLSLAYGTHQVLVSAAVWCGHPLDTVLDEFPRRMLERLEEIEVSDSALRAWGALFP